MSENLEIDAVEEEEDEDEAIVEYELTVTPNDFNVFTVNDFIKRGIIRVPSFQRNYVWDLKGASRLMESILLGLPIPQIFLYEESKNSYLIIDGQQRLLSIYYFMRGRFPRQDKRALLRRLFDERRGDLPAEQLADDELFQPFKLHLKASPYDGLKYETLGESRSQYELRTLRCIVVRQTRPEGDISSVLEIFSRLNTGGVKLSEQEIRASVFHSLFYEMLARLNLNPEWRRLVGDDDPEIHMRDTEALLRAFAMSIDGGGYKSSSMKKFLADFSQKAKRFDSVRVAEMERNAVAFFAATRRLPRDVFHGATGKFSVTMFESAFAAISGSFPNVDMAAVERISALKADGTFRSLITTRSSNRANVTLRLERAKRLLIRGDLESAEQ